MSFEMIMKEKEDAKAESVKLKYSLSCCIYKFLNFKESKILKPLCGIFIFSFGVVLLVGHYAINNTTSSTGYITPAIPDLVASAVIMANGILFTSVYVKKHLFTIIFSILLSSVSALLSPVGVVHYGLTLTNFIFSLNKCSYDSYKQRCACSVTTSYSSLKYEFDDTTSCESITEHLGEIAVGMSSVYLFTCLCSFSASVHLTLLAHNMITKTNRVKRMKRRQQRMQEKIETKEEISLRNIEDGFLSKNIKDNASVPELQDATTQTKSRDNGTVCPPQCHKLAEVKIPNRKKDYVDMSKSQDPPPPYWETLYTRDRHDFV